MAHGFRLTDDSYTLPPVRLSRREAPTQKTGRYGTFDFDQTGIVTAFTEKCERDQGWINAGIYLLDRHVLDLVPADRPVSIEEEIFPLLAARQGLFAYPTPPPVLDMGTPEGLEETENYLHTKEAD